MSPRSSVEPWRRCALPRALTAFGGDAVTAGLFISNAALALTAVLFYRLAEEQWGTAVAERAIWYGLCQIAVINRASIYFFCIALR